MGNNEGGVHDIITFSIFRNVPEENNLSIPIVSDLNLLLTGPLLNKSLKIYLLVTKEYAVSFSNCTWCGSTSIITEPGIASTWM